MPAFIKIVKFLIGCVVVCCLFIFFMVTAMTSVPYLTTRHYKNDESPSYTFKVVLETFEPSLNQPRFECVRWDDFKAMQPLAQNQNVYLDRETYECQGTLSVFEREYSTYLSVSEGSCHNISSDFIVQNVDAHTQVVRLRWAQEAFKVRNSYRVDRNGVNPLYLCEFMSAGICVMIFLVSVIALPVSAIFFRICRKKYGKLVSAGWAFVLVGLGTLNFAIFNYRLSSDPLTESPEMFVYRIKIVILVSCILFVCAGFSFWNHKKKQIPTRNGDR